MSYGWAKFLVTIVFGFMVVTTVVGIFALLSGMILVVGGILAIVALAVSLYRGVKKGPAWKRHRQQLDEEWVQRCREDAKRGKDHHRIYAAIKEASMKSDGKPEWRVYRNMCLDMAAALSIDPWAPMKPGCATGGERPTTQDMARYRVS
ncbi:hypothetical protein ACWERI_28915 [Streptomyces collinus]